MVHDIFRIRHMGVAGRGMGAFESYDGCKEGSITSEEEERNARCLNCSAKLHPKRPYHTGYHRGFLGSSRDLKPSLDSL